MYDVIMYSKRAWFATLIIFFIGITFTFKASKGYKPKAGFIRIPQECSE